MDQCKVRHRGLIIGTLPTGKNNCITDVADVHTGHVTLKDQNIYTGITALLPHSGDLFQQKVTASTHVLNGFTKCTGLLQIDELGTIETPIMLTNTLSVGKVADCTVDYMLQNNKNSYRINSVNPVVLECNDGYLNDINQKTISSVDVLTAINGANSQPTKEGSVGAGKGMITFGYKSGIGCSSRKIVDKQTDTQYTVGTLVLSNFGKKGQLQIQGQNIESLLNDQNNPQEQEQTNNKSKDPMLPDSNGSIIMLVATDAPFESRQLRRLAKRAPLGLSKLGGYAAHGSGEVAIAFSNTNTVPHILNDNEGNVQKYGHNTFLDHPELMNLLFQGVVESIEESVLNALSCSETITGYRNRTVYNLPWEKVIHRFINNPCG